MEHLVNTRHTDQSTYNHRKETTEDVLSLIEGSLYYPETIIEVKFPDGSGFTVRSGA